MWQPRLADRQCGYLYGAREGAGPDAVIAILDPPRHALPAGAYPAAQRNVAELYSRIPTDEPFLLGLQEEFWLEAERRRVADTGDGTAESRLEAGGSGIAEALARESRRTEVVRLEDPGFVAEYRHLEASAVAYLERAAPFFQALVDAFREGTLRYSEPMREFTALLERRRSPNRMPLAEYAPLLLDRARSLGLELSGPAYRSLLLLDRCARLERSGDEEAVKLERITLATIAKTLLHASPPARPVWELHRRELADRREADPEIETELERVNRLLELEEPPPPDAGVLESVRRFVAPALETELWTYRVWPGADKSALLGGHAEAISHLLEVATILGLDASRYPKLVNYVRYGYAHRRLVQVTGGSEGRAVAEALGRLEREIVRHLAREETDSVLVGLEPAIRFLEALTRYQFVHDEDLRLVVLTLDLLTLCETLEGAGVSAPPGWREEAAALSADFGLVRDYCDLTLLRGKDLARVLLEAMEAASLRRGVLCCDGYLHASLARWFEGREVSYCMVTPSW